MGGANVRRGVTASAIAAVDGIGEQGVCVREKRGVGGSIGGGGEEKRVKGGAIDK